MLFASLFDLGRGLANDYFDRYARGQVTFRKDVLQHLGIQPGEKIELDKRPYGAVTLRAARPRGKIDSFVGLLAGKTSKIATLEELDKAAADGWSGRK